jgi:hypothetical protein
MKLFSMNSFGLIFLTILLNPQACSNCECGDPFQTKTMEERIYEDIEYLEQIKNNPDVATIEDILQNELSCKKEDVESLNN